MAIYKHYEGYGKAREEVYEQSLEDDLSLIDSLMGRDNLDYNASPSDVKQEALRQLEIDWREEIDEMATFWIDIVNASPTR